jgi:hypothetical protein
MDKREIKLAWTTVDRAYESRTFKTLAGARKYAHRKVGATPEIGTYYAIDGYGVSKIVVRAGTTLKEIFPDAFPGERLDDGSYDRGPYSRWE